MLKNNNVKYHNSVCNTELFTKNKTKTFKIFRLFLIFAILTMSNYLMSFQVVIKSHSLWVALY